ncbi:DUF2842 domain-containing protein [Nitratireductor aquimarinus]|uniref:DUF2842 domain-containing protein n=1 Tax=Nitratireductor aquimarinus TaxID=889300 RepID=A0ABU4AJ79_9HYPH|nr:MULTISPECIES: DUF2842 domain-containing protein [Alphaproteobacteria]MBY6023978.1 DUF2842 domain-containing protein [Nitratireductor sp. DP7N14-4]MBN7759017.1 DUF2842 domain-containing protein [Nitratireductor aquimarinus]MBN7763474.1 DUF2842 domain-containing protein [Nitratireductor aquibiodomus]MBN7778760.1 DUF2842 domain-containing protein [Nitratireductor pacificus]MBN7783083.1 DUF2842 domain-containing protein [Nitratireductor pacificus]
MPVRLRKFIGMVALVALVVVYAILSTAIAVAQLADAGPLMHLAYYFLTGLLWIIPAMFIIRWMIGRPQNDA